MQQFVRYSTLRGGPGIPTKRQLCSMCAQLSVLRWPGILCCHCWPLVGRTVRVWVGH